MALKPPTAVGIRFGQARYHPEQVMMSFQMGSEQSYEYWHMQGIWWWDRGLSDVVMDHPNGELGWVKVGPPLDPDDGWIIPQVVRFLERVSLSSWVQDAKNFLDRFLDFSPPTVPVQPPVPVDPIDLPDPIDDPAPGGTPLETQQASAFPAIAGLGIIIARFAGPLVRGLRIPWGNLPGWLRTILIALGFTEGVDIIWDLASGDQVEIGPFPIGGSGSDDPTTNMVEAMTVSTWQANGVTFHRLSDGRLATRNKHGVWKIWRPKKPIVIFATGMSNLPDLLRADNAIDKQAKKMARTLRKRGYQVRRKVDSS